MTVDGAVVNDPGAIVSRDVALRWDRNLRKERRVQTSLAVLYEDDDAIAVFKPSGLLTHPTEAKEIDTLLAASPSTCRGATGGASERSCPSSTGSTRRRPAFSSSRGAGAASSACRRSFARTRWTAATAPSSRETSTGDAGTFDRDLVEDRATAAAASRSRGEPAFVAVTEWTVVERFGLATLVEARLKTGRTHQIRIHFASAGHPPRRRPVYRDPKKPPFPVSLPAPGAPRRAPRIHDTGGQEGLAGRGPSGRLPQAAGRFEEEEEEKDEREDLLRRCQCRRGGSGPLPRILDARDASAPSKKPAGP